MAYLHTLSAAVTLSKSSHIGVFYLTGKLQASKSLKFHHSFAILDGIVYTTYMEDLFNPLLIGTLIIVITIHEFAHAYVADRLGDPTPRLAGRLTLNPLAHLDPIGSIVFIISSLGGFAFGWAKPVPFDTFNLANPKRDSMLIALAGPVSNFLLAALCSLILNFVLPLTSDQIINIFQPFLKILIIFNISLGIFNLIPIHPLDGGKILVGLLPADLSQRYNYFISRYGYIFLLILLVTDVFPKLIGPIINTIVFFLIPMRFF